ncbi:LITAF-like zinc finger domain-containing protein [Colletotrichum graminicola]|uniref:LITAF-like zinc finger domain-containing protein n=1 Tax=Colletotrichum graminicola (strain M1.001 / M2 / FGSC 10212) TaxID=645133 RepID=E3QQF0_COLGM|nr:LITAF-like zinc finger domain-containing protein [Colletotrichum graminicola M1.001]EFQ33088.1 LITAF-like zinc finger domain-containing protein [Colletotrichum graminicola M1.001]WDK21977.1 LITAF-like zinc finger domain-containing protein [Colletotrichum graminicola]
MDKPAQQQAPGPDNYAPSGPPPEYQHQQTGTTAAATPKYGGPPNDTPQPRAYGGYSPPLQEQQQQPQSFPMQPGGPQNFQPYGTPLPALGPHPAPVECPDCHARGVTAVEYSSGGFTHALAAIVCFVSCLGCIPYLFTSLKDARHKCYKCGIPLATYHRSGRTEVHWHQAYHG